MKGLSREESKLLVKAVLAGESGAFDEFHKQFNRIIWDIATKWTGSIFSASRGMFTTEDIVNEIWLHIWWKLPQFDADKANMMTWLCVVSENKAGMLYRMHKSTTRYAGDGKMMSLQDTVTDKDGSDIEFISLITDPQESFDSIVISESIMYDYLFLLSKTVASFSHLYKLVYIHMIKGLKQNESAAITGLSQSYVARIRQKIILKAKYIWEIAQVRHTSTNKSHKFAINLLSGKSEEDLMEEFGYDLAVIKICREFLDLADIARVKQSA